MTSIGRELRSHMECESMLGASPTVYISSNERLRSEKHSAKQLFQVCGSVLDPTQHFTVTEEATDPLFPPFTQPLLH
jgi:hypothetical protein